VVANKREFSVNTLGPPAVPRFILRVGGKAARKPANIYLPQPASHFGFSTAQVCHACQLGSRINGQIWL